MVGAALVDVAVAAGLQPSKGAARRLIKVSPVHEAADDGSLVPGRLHAKRLCPCLSKTTSSLHKHVACNMWGKGRAVKGCSSQLLIGTVV